MRKKVLFSVVTTVLFFLGLELLLSLAGVRPLLYDDDPHVGFASNIPLFVEGSRGTLVTASNKVRWFNPQQFPGEKGAGVRRVFCVGGSTTYGRPYADSTSFCGWLREYLPIADASQKWEVINAGGISYASYRVAKVMEELIAYEPDLFVVYSGHNEFLEERTYADLVDTPEAVRGIQAALGHTRTYSFLANLMHGRGQSNTAENAEVPVLEAEVNTILDQSAGLDLYTRDPELTEKIASHYRFNLARMVDIARSGGARILFVTPAANIGDSSPFKSQHTDGLTDQQLRKWKRHHDEAGKAYNEQRYQPALTAIDLALAIDSDFAHSLYLRAQILEKLGDFDAARTDYFQALEADVCPLRIRSAMREILKEVAVKRGVPLFDYHSYLEGKSEHQIVGDEWFLDHVHPTVEGHRLLALEIIQLLASENILLERSALDQESINAVKTRVMADIDDESHGIALRNLGNVLNWAGKKQEAYTAVIRALELAPGDAYAHYLAGDLAGFLGEASEAEARFLELTRFDLDPDDAPYFPDAHFQLAQIVGARGETEQSLQLLEKTLALQSDHQGARAALPIVLQAHGKRLLLQGRHSEAAAILKKLQKLTPDDVMVANLLGAALIQGKKFQDAIDVLSQALRKDPRNLSIHNNIGSAYAQSGQPDEAAHHFKQVVGINPSHVGAQLNLARLFESMGENALAAERYRAVLKLQPSSREASAGLERISKSLK